MMTTKYPILLSHHEARAALDAREGGAGEVILSADLNRSQTKAILSDEGIRFTDETLVSWDSLGMIASDENTCFSAGPDGVEAIRVFSETTQWVRSLYPTKGAPSTLVSGMIMHRIEGTDPMKDTLTKVKAAGVPVGNVLDICTGLGYTAIEASRTADHVTTIELDPATIAIARMNPWSAELFDNPKITLLTGDAWDIIEEMTDGSFTRIIHDPPTFQFAGELYSGDFYSEMYRVLSGRGRLFHYIGDPASKIGARVTKGVIRRLTDAGFKRVTRAPAAFGVVAYKGGE